MTSQFCFEHGVEFFSVVGESDNAVGKEINGARVGVVLPSERGLIQGYLILKNRLFESVFYLVKFTLDEFFASSEHRFLGRLFVSPSAFKFSRREGAIVSKSQPARALI